MTLHCPSMPLADPLMKPMMAAPWESVEPIAGPLGVIRDSSNRRIARKNLPAHRVGRLWKFTASEVDERVRVGGAHEARNVGGSAASKH